MLVGMLGLLQYWSLEPILNRNHPLQQRLSSQPHGKDCQVELVLTVVPSGAARTTQRLL